MTALRKLLCLLVGHRDGPVRQDGRGAAWIRCSRCGALIGAHTWHGGTPWESDR